MPIHQSMFKSMPIQTLMNEHGFFSHSSIFVYASYESMPIHQCLHMHLMGAYGERVLLKHPYSSLYCMSYLMNCIILKQFCWNI